MTSASSPIEIVAILVVFTKEAFGQASEVEILVYGNGEPVSDEDD